MGYSILGGGKTQNTAQHDCLASAAGRHEIMAGGTKECAAWWLFIPRPEYILCATLGEGMKEASFILSSPSYS